MQNDTATVAVVDTADNNQNDTNTNTAPVQKRKVGRPPNDPNTKLARAKALFPGLVEQGLSRSEILDTFETELECTRGTAQVYFHEAKKAHPDSQVTRKPKAKTPKADATPATDTAPAPAAADTDADAEVAG